MINPIIQFFFFIFESVISIALMYLLLQAVLKKSNQATQKQLVAIFGVAIFMQISFNYIFPSQNEFNTIFFQGTIVGAVFRIAIALVIATICFRARPLISISVALLELIIGMLIILLIMSIMGSDLSNIGVIRDGMLRTSQYSNFTTIMAIPIHVFVIVLIRHFRDFRIENRYFKLSFIVGVVVCVFTFVVMRVLMLLHLHPYEHVQVQELIEIVPVMAIAFAIAPILILASGLGGQSINKQKIFLLESQHLAQLKHIEQLMSSYEKIRKMSHDFKHRVDILHVLSAENEHEKLAEYISDLSKRDASISVVETGNVMLDAVLSFKKEKAEAERITYNLKLDVQPNLSYVNDKICVLLSNALDNAIEACMRINVTKGSENKRFIDMELTATDSLFMCRIRNAVGIIPQMENGIFKTIKTNKVHHGIGMQSMKQTCQDLGGELAYEYDEKEFRLWINLPPNNLFESK